MRGERRGTLLVSACTALMGTTDVRELAAIGARAGVPELADVGVVDLIAPGAGELAVERQVHAAPGHEPLAAAFLERSPARDVGALGRALAGGQLESHRDGDRAHAVVPLVARGEPMGALVLVRGAARPPFDAADLALAAELAERTAMAIDLARRYDGERTRRIAAEARAGRLARLLDIAAAGPGAGSLDELLAPFVAAACELTGASRATIHTARDAFASAGVSDAAHESLAVPIMAHDGRTVGVFRLSGAARTLGPDEEAALHELARAASIVIAWFSAAVAGGARQR